MCNCKEKIKKANGNIEILIDIIINAEKEKMRSYCVDYVDKGAYPNWKNEFCKEKYHECCDECSNDYYSYLKRKMLEDYLVKI